MFKRRAAALLPALALTAPAVARVSDDVVRVGVLNDHSGIYADIGGKPPPMGILGTGFMAAPQASGQAVPRRPTPGALADRAEIAAVVEGIDSAVDAKDWARARVHFTDESTPTARRFSAARRRGCRRMR